MLLNHILKFFIGLIKKNEYTGIDLNQIVTSIITSIFKNKPSCVTTWIYIFVFQKNAMTPPEKKVRRTKLEREIIPVPLFTAKYIRLYNQSNKLYTQRK